MKNAMKKVALFATAIILFGCASDDEPEEVISGASPTTTTEVNENGNIVIKYDNSSTEITITTSKPVNAGVLEIKHKKSIFSEYC